MTGDLGVLERLYDPHFRYQMPIDEDLDNFNDLMEIITPQENTENVIHFDATRYGGDSKEVANSYSELVGSAKTQNSKLKVHTNGHWNQDITIKLKTKETKNPNVLLKKYKKLSEASSKAYKRAKSTDYTVEYIMGAIGMTTISLGLYALAVSEGISP